MPRAVSWRYILRVQKTYLRSLDMVMEVVTEGLNVRDNLISSLAGQVSREEDYRQSDRITEYRRNTYQR
jgi:hypothetical protein